jgi:hypothetical protein
MARFFGFAGVVALLGIDVRGGAAELLAPRSFWRRGSLPEGRRINQARPGRIPCSHSASFPDHAARERTGVAVQAMLSLERDSLRAAPDLGISVCFFG